MQTFRGTWKEVASNSLTWICWKKEEFGIKMGDRIDSSSPWACQASSLSYVTGLQIREAVETSSLPTLGRAVFCGRVTHPLLLPRVPGSVFLTLLARKDLASALPTQLARTRVWKSRGVCCLGLCPCLLPDLPRGGLGHSRGNFPATWVLELLFCGSVLFYTSSWPLNLVKERTIATCPKITGKLPGSQSGNRGRSGATVQGWRQRGLLAFSPPRDGRGLPLQTIGRGKIK